MKRVWALVIVACVASVSLAADNQLSEREKSDGWVLLFDGQTLSGWKNNKLQSSKRPVEENSLNPHKCGGNLLIHEKQWTDFILSLDFKITKGCNSGIFLRTDKLTFPPRGNIELNGFEVAIDDTKTAGFYDTGAFYDLVKPKRNAMKPIGEWNHIIIRCDGSIISVNLNSEDVSRINLDEWTQPGQRLDGSKNRYVGRIPKTHSHTGYIGLQDHGSDCWFKNIKLKPLNGNATQPTSTHVTG
jgi:hypothetical protein